MQADPSNAADALAVAVINTLAFPVGFVRVAGTSPSLGAVGAFDLGRRLAAEDSPPSEAPLRMLSDPPNGSMVLSVTFEVLSETVTIDQTYASLDNLINNQIVNGQALQDTLVDQVKQYTQSMVLTCTVECAEVYDAQVDSSGYGGAYPTTVYDPSNPASESSGDGYGGAPQPSPSQSGSGYADQDGGYAGDVPCSQDDGCGGCDYDGDGRVVVGATDCYYPQGGVECRRNDETNHCQYGNGRLRRLEERRLQYSMSDFPTVNGPNDLVAFVDYWKVKNNADGTAPTDPIRSDLFANHLFDEVEGVDAVDALSAEAAIAWYQVGGCPTTSIVGGALTYELYGGDPFSTQKFHPYNDLKGHCLRECCGCKICEDYYAGVNAGNQSIVMQEFEAYCKTHERSCMSGECSMCGPCFASCSYDESEIASDAKAMLSFLMAAKKPDVTLCKMCCHMDMNAVSDTWDGIAQCPSEMTAKARHEMGCDTWDFLVSCTCEKDFWRDLEGQNNILPAVDEKSRELAAWCKNAVTWWVSVYHCNDVYASLSRDQPALEKILESSGLAEDFLTEPSEERPAPSLCDICGATCAFNFDGACMCPLNTGPPPDEKYAMFIFGGLVGGFAFVQFYSYFNTPVA